MIRIFLNFMLAILMSLSLGLETVQPVMAGDASASRQRSQSETPALINAARPPAGSSYAPGASDTSVYMIGSTTVGVVFIESVGSGETWSAPRQAEVSGEITAALDQWEGWGGMDAGLSFVVDTRAIGVNQEPITLDSADTSWEYEALGTIPGVTGGTDAERAYSFDNQLRLANSTDWAFTLFVVDSFNDTDGAFSDGKYAFSGVFGPYAVITYDNGPHGTQTLDIAVARETAHIFGAGYQNDGSCASTSQLFGYLGIANANCVVSGVDPTNNGIDRLMRDVAVLGDPDQTTREQIGWRDSDNDFVYGPVDTTVQFTVLAYDPHFTAASVLYYTGSAQEVPFPHVVCTGGDFCYGSDVSITHISDIQARADSSVYVNATPADGTYDSQYEEFTFTVGVSGEGVHTIEAIAYRNTSGSGPADLLTNHAQPPYADSIEKNEIYRGDDSAGPKIISPTSSGTETWITSAMTQSWDDPQPLGCDPNNSNPAGNDLTAGPASVWYSFTPVSDVAVAFDTFGSEYDTYLVVYTLTNPSNPNPRGNNLTQVYCSDDSAGGSQSSYILNATTGTTYLIEVAEFTGVKNSHFNININASSEVNAQYGGNLVFHWYVPVRVFLPLIHR